MQKKLVLADVSSCYLHLIEPKSFQVLICTLAFVSMKTSIIEEGIPLVLLVRNSGE